MSAAAASDWLLLASITGSGRSVDICGITGGRDSMGSEGRVEASETVESEETEERGDSEEGVAGSWSG